MLIIYQEGGIYYDTDVELIKKPDQLLKNEAFYGFENEQNIATGLGFGACMNHPSLLAMIRQYENLKPDIHGDYTCVKCPQLNTAALLDYGLILNGKMQDCGGAIILPVEFFNPYDDPTGRLNITANMHYYKWAYRMIAGAIAVLGLMLAPFLDLLIKNPGNVGNVHIYYFIYLFNTVTSYLVSYKYSLVNAEQKNYIYTNVNLLISSSTIILQIITIVIWKNFLVYLSVTAIFGIFQKIFISIYFNRLYPYLKEKNTEKLTKEEKHLLISKIKALILHKIGDVSVHQTDNIIVSAFVSTKMVGLLSNYNLIINTVSSCINVLFNSVIGSLGNMAAMESKDYQYKVFKKYRFIGFWFYGFTSIALAILMTPFITIWIGKKMIVDVLVINLLVIDYYMIGQRICLNNIKSAAGVYEPDKYVALLQAAVNLISSVILAKIIGLPGVFVGTILQGMLSSILKPILSYKMLFGISSKFYFIDSAKYAGAVIGAYVICYILSKLIIADITVVNFAVLAICVVIIPNVMFGFLFYKTEEFQYYYNMLKSIALKK